MTLNYQQTLNKALCELRSLNVNQALILFNRLLKEHPQDLELIKRIVLIENRKKESQGYKAICQHIFSIDSKSQTFHQYIISTFKAYNEKFETSIEPNKLTEQQVFNLFFHLGKTGNVKDCNLLKTHIKQNLTEHSNTANALLNYCEQLIDKKKLLLAEKELEYLIIYYVEAETTITAGKLLKKTRGKLRLNNNI
jgi:hypothetical protein